MLEPSFRADARLLILGSWPGAQSLREGRYYANPGNRFWPLMERLTGRELVPLVYGDRLEQLKDAGVALWDSLASAERRGSLDSAIRNAMANDLHAFAAGLPALRAIGCNGALSWRYALKGAVGVAVPLLRLPSTSAANAALRLDDLAAAWTENLAPYLT